MKDLKVSKVELDELWTFVKKYLNKKILTSKEYNKYQKEPLRKREIYTYIWWTFADEDFRNGCHRRWESFHTSMGIIISLILSSAISLPLSIKYSYFDQFIMVFVIFILISIILSINAYNQRKNASLQEITWWKMFIADVDKSIIKMNKSRIDNELKEEK